MAKVISIFNILSAMLNTIDVLGAQRAIQNCAVPPTPFLALEAAVQATSSCPVNTLWSPS